MDHNTRFFIKKLVEDKGKMGYVVDLMMKAFGMRTREAWNPLLSLIFTKLFHSQGHEEASVVLDLVEPKVTPNMNRELVAPFLNEEI